MICLRCGVAFTCHVCLFGLLGSLDSGFDFGLLVCLIWVFSFFLAGWCFLWCWVWW